MLDRWTLALLTGTAQALHEGVALTRDLYKASLEKFGVRPIPVELGEPFVAARHQKVDEIESASDARSFCTKLSRKLPVGTRNRLKPASF